MLLMRSLSKSSLFGMLLSIVAGGLVIAGVIDRWIGDLGFEVRLRKSSFYVGEPVVADFVWSNESRFTLGVEYWVVARDPLGYFEGIVVGPDLEPTLLFEDGQELKGRPRRLGPLREVHEWLFPGREIRRAVRLEDAFDLSRHGRYKLQVVYTPWYGDSEPGLAGRWRAKRFRSVAETHFEIRPWSDESLVDARSQAAAGDPGAVRLLGLHGDDESISLVLECSASEDREVRYEAAYALGRIGTSEAIASLGEVAVGELDPIIKLQMVVVLMDVDSPEALPWLKLMLHDTVDVSEFSYGSGKRVRFYPIRSAVLTYLENRGEDVEAIFEEEISDSE
ncbi:MAG: HEAT repeat domain-containing protein [bacterium]|nr:HEAT repeat domain-containing protein [bacterium]